MIIGIRATDLDETHKIVDQDGMIYTVTGIVRKREMVCFNLTHDNNDLLITKIKPHSVRVRAASMLRVLEQ